jgi:hypothetical protein
VCFRRQHAGLPSAVGMSAEPDMLWFLFARLDHLLAQAFAIAFGIGRAGRTVRALLPKGQVVAQDLDARRSEGVRHRYQQRGVAIRSGAVSENQKIHDWFWSSCCHKMKKGRLVGATLSSIFYLKLLARAE